MQTFVAGGLFASRHGYALGAYRPLYLKQNGEKVKNPAFDQYSQHVLNLKSGTHPRYAEPSIKFCMRELQEFLNSGIKLTDAEFLIVPSCTQGKTSESLERIVKSVCKTDKRFSYRPQALSRQKSIEKLAKGGNRSIDVHVASLAYTDDPNASHTKIILDDVLTSGNSIEGAIRVIEQVRAGLFFVPIVFGKTTHD